MGGGGKKKFPEGAIRINFLHQARHEIMKNVQGRDHIAFEPFYWGTKISGHYGRVLAANLGQNMVGCGRKSQIRLGSDIKKQLCKVSIMFMWLYSTFLVSTFIPIQYRAVFHS